MASSDDQKVNVGNFTFIIKADELKRINAKIGDVLEAQVIFRGSDNLGFGTVSVKSEEEAAAAPAGEDEISGTFSGSKRGTRKPRVRGAKSTRGRGGSARARRSADDPDSQYEGNGHAATSEAAAQNGEVSVKAVTDGLAAAAIGEDGKPVRGGKRGARGGRTPRAPRARGEPSKTLVFIRNLPYSYTEADVEALLKSNGLSYTSVSVPVWKFGMHKGKGRGFAFANVEEQDKVIETLTGKEIIGQTAASKAPEGNPDSVTATDGEEKPTTRTFKLVARQGFENEDSEKAAEGADETGAANHDDVQVADKNGNETAAESVVVAN